MGSISTDGQRPSFLHVLLEDFDTKLELSEACAEILESVPSKVTIRTQYGSWPATVKKKLNELGNSSFYLQGRCWVDLVKHNDLRKGDILVFSLLDPSEFHLFVFGKTSCLKKLKRGNKPKNTSEKKVTRFTQVEVKLKKKFNLFGLKVPADFVEQTGMQRMKKVMVKDSEGRVFSVKVGLESDGGVLLGDGWGKFVEQNGLEVGMTCLIRSAIRDADTDDADDVVLNVSTVETM